MHVAIRATVWIESNNATLEYCTRRGLQRRMARTRLQLRTAKRNPVTTPFMPLTSFRWKRTKTRTKPRMTSGPSLKFFRPLQSNCFYGLKRNPKIKRQWPRLQLGLLSSTRHCSMIQVHHNDRMVVSKWTSDSFVLQLLVTATELRSPFAQFGMHSEERAD